jgi:hypothetical protein
LSKKLEGVLSCINAYQSRSDILWPLPLISLLYTFGINKKLDDEFGDEFCIYPPLIQFWSGIIGVGNSFSFVIPNKARHHNSYLNTISYMALFGSLTRILQFNEQFIASAIDKLINSFTQIESLSISFMRLTSFMCSTDSDVWSASRDIILKPFLKKANPDLIKNLATNIGILLEKIYTKIKKEKNYKKVTALLKEEQKITKSDCIPLLNVYIGEVEFRLLSLLCYINNEHEVLSPKLFKKCTKLLVLLLLYSYSLKVIEKHRIGVKS